MASRSLTERALTRHKTVPPRAPGLGAPTSVHDVQGLQRAIGNRATGRVVSALAERRVQRYHVLGAAQYAINGVHNEFEAQTVGGGAIGPPAPANPAQIRVSNDGNMALEHTDLSARQPKVFYATTGVVNAGNVGLAAVHSDYKLYIDRANAITVTVPGNPPKTLNRVLPQVKRTGMPKPRAPRAASQTGTTMDVAQDCVMVAHAVMKHANGGRQPRTAHNLPNLGFAEYRVAQYISKLVEQRAYRSTWASWRDPGAWIHFSAESAALAEVTGGAALTQPALDAIAVSYMGLLQNQPAVAAAVAQELGVNVSALPDVGEAYETHRIGTGQPSQTTQGVGRPTRHFWGQHIGAVVAASGSDRVTLENYARSHEIGALAAGPHYYFQMYGTGLNQSWHEAWTTGAVAANVPPIGRPSPQDEALTVVVRSG